MAILTKRCYFYFSIVLIGAIALVSLLYFLSQVQKAKIHEAPPVDETEVPEEAIVPSKPEELKEGEVGEVKVKDEETGEETLLISPTMPAIISATVGTIVEIRADSLIVAGSGTNFEDRTPRDLTCIFTDKTLTFIKEGLQYKQYEGKEGLKFLKKGMKVSIGGDENIRGKTEFKVKTINVLE